MVHPCLHLELTPVTGNSIWFWSNPNKRGSKKLDLGGKHLILGSYELDFSSEDIDFDGGMFIFGGKDFDSGFSLSCL